MGKHTKYYKCGVGYSRYVQYMARINLGTKLCLDTFLHTYIVGYVLGRNVLAGGPSFRASQHSHSCIFAFLVLYVVFSRMSSFFFLFFFEKIPNLETFTKHLCCCRALYSVQPDSFYHNIFNGINLSSLPCNLQCHQILAPTGSTSPAFMSHSALPPLSWMLIPAGNPKL